MQKLYFLTLYKVNRLKQKLVNRIFWGRGNYYRNLNHLTLIFLSLAVVMTGIFTRISAEDSKIVNKQSSTGTFDLIEQGGSIETVILLDPKFAGIEINYYTTQPNDDLVKIAEKFGITADTIRWANRGVVNPFTNNVEEGVELSIPSLNGVLYTVRAGQSIHDVARDTNGNVFDIAEFNELSEPFTISEGQTLFVPDGNLVDTGFNVVGIPRGVFTNPLGHPNCQGYSQSRGFLSYHNGVDLAFWKGCPISAVANGTVIYSGWGNAGEGYHVKIDHGGGIMSQYFHGNGEMWVKTGDRVQQGQPLMFMGCTGYCTGTHLHFSLWKDGIAVDPAPFVPY